MNTIERQFLGFINTPALFQNFHGLNQFELDSNIINNSDFSQLIITEKLPLGKRIERFFEFYIKQSNNYELVKNNIQIIHDGETLGEIDFLIYDKSTEKYLHIEHIYKYYLYDESFENEIDRFIGPNRDDSFVKKIAKLKDKQLPLLYKNETQDYLDGLDINAIEQQVCFKGNIYVPLHLLGKALPVINNASVRGFYINHKAFLNQLSFRDYEYYLPPRNDWVCDCTTNKTWQSFDRVIEEVNLLINHQKSTLVWMKKENQVQSFFVTWW